MEILRTPSWLTWVSVCSDRNTVESVGLLLFSGMFVLFSFFVTSCVTANRCDLTLQHRLVLRKEVVSIVLSRSWFY